MKKAKCLLAVGLVAVLLTACGGSNGANGDNERENNVTPPSNGSNYSETTEASPYDFTETLMDLEGRVITLLAIDVRNHWDYDFDDIDRTPNETLRVMEILREIESDYNTEIELFWHEPPGLLALIQQNRIAGDAPFDLFELNLSDFTVNTLWSQGLVMPVNHPAINDIIMPLENPWKATEFTTFGDTQWAVHFKPFNTPTVLRDVLIFNETLRSRFGLPVFYDMVRERTWDWNNFENILSEIVTASNGQVFPVMYWHESSITPIFIASNNGTIVETGSGGLTFVGDVNDNALAAMNFIRSMAEREFFHPSAPRHAHFATEHVGGVMARGEALFLFGEYATMKNLTRQALGYENDFTFGILPPPIGPNGTNFTAVITSEMLYHVMADIERPYQAAAILVAIANRTAQRTYRVVDHERRYSLQSEASAEMLEILLNNITVDVSRIHGGSRSAGGQGIVGAGLRILRLEHTPVQAMQYIGSQVQTWFDALNDLDISDTY